MRQIRNPARSGNGRLSGLLHPVAKEARITRTTAPGTSVDSTTMFFRTVVNEQFTRERAAAAEASGAELERHSLKHRSGTSLPAAEPGEDFDAVEKGEAAGEARAGEEGIPNWKRALDYIVIS